MKYIMEGYSTVEIGKKIGVSKRTIIRDIGKIRQVSAL